MQVIEKVKVVPEGYNGAGMDGYGRRDVNGKANAGLTLGIIGTALGAWALFGNNRRSTGLLGAAGGGMLGDADGYTIGDIYVAINAQYHDYCELFEKWFGSNFDEKIIASAVDFWFEDDDFDGNKVWKYFNEM